MEWQAVVLAMQILMLAVGWFLFQQARGELSARAAETPVLGEVKALQQNIKTLLTDLKQTSEATTTELETRCGEARRMHRALDSLLEELSAAKSELEAAQTRLAAEPLPALTLVAEPENNYKNRAEFERAARLPGGSPAAVCLPQAAPSPRELRRERVFALADAGRAAGEIARESGLSEGEVETLIGLRLQRA